MWKKMLAFLVIGLVAGGAIAFMSRGGAGVSGSGDDAVANLKRSVDALDRRVVELSAQVEALQRRSISARAMPGADDGAAAPGVDAARAPRDPEAIRQAMEQRRAQFDPAAMIERRQQQELDRLVAGGFTRDRAEWIMRRTEELQVQAMQAQYEAQRSGRQAQGMDIEQQLRKELGETEYERYLAATGRPTEVPVMGVLASSAAERSGLKPGDQIVSYAGTRVYDTRDLNQLTLAGSPGESVTVEVKRNGQSVQISVPRGPLGVQTGGPGGGPGGRGGPPGGFRGGR